MPGSNIKKKPPENYPQVAFRFYLRMHTHFAQYGYGHFMYRQEHYIKRDYIYG